jgi:hypothetical protein
MKEGDEYKFRDEQNERWHVKRIGGGKFHFRETGMSGHHGVVDLTGHIEPSAKNSSPAWTPPIGFTHTRCANGSTVGAFTGSPMISGFSKSQAAKNAGAGQSDSWEKQHGGFTNQDHARAAAREFAFSSDAARDLSLVPTHHNHEGAHFPALEVPTRRRMQVLKARLDQFGIKHKDVGNNTVAVWHPSMKMVANSGDQSDIDMDKRSWAATRAAYKRTERAYQVGGFTEHHNAMKSHLEAAELHKKSYPHDSEKIIERRKKLVDEHNDEADQHEQWLMRTMPRLGRKYVHL